MSARRSAHGRRPPALSARSRHGPSTPSVDPGAPAVILFTSGTEGDPKGVVLSHRNIVANIHQILAHVPEALRLDDILFSPLPTFHCFGLTAGALLPLLGGMKLRAASLAAADQNHPQARAGNRRDLPSPPTPSSTSIDAAPGMNWVSPHSTKVERVHKPQPTHAAD